MLESRQVSFKMEGNGMNMRKRAERREWERITSWGGWGTGAGLRGRVLCAVPGRPAARDVREQ